VALLPSLFEHQGLNLDFRISWQNRSLLFFTLLHHNPLMLQVIPGSSKSIWPALCAGGLGGLAAYTALAWILHIQSISVAPSLVPNATQAAGLQAAQNAIQSSHVAAALGAPKAAVGPSGANAGASSEHQWSLLGVVAGASGRGSALLAVDGQAPKAYLPGETVAPGWVLHSVGHRLARLAPSQQGTPTVVLELPKTDN
jgi:general secretion pathway protein C